MCVYFIGVASAAGDKNLPLCGWKISVDIGGVRVNLCMPGLRFDGCREPGTKGLFQVIGVGGKAGTKHVGPVFPCFLSGMWLIWPVKERGSWWNVGGIQVFW